MTDKEQCINDLAEDLEIVYDDEVDLYNEFSLTSYIDYQETATKLIDKGYHKIIPNVDFVVRAGELVTIREKAVNDTIGTLYNKLTDMQQVCEECVRDDVNKAKNEAQVEMLEMIKTMLKRDFGVEVNRWAASKKD